MTMSLLKTSLILLALSTPCFSQGAPWTEEETLIIFKKIQKIFESPAQIVKKYKNIHGDLPNYPPKTTPNAPKMLRLAFHDCLPYTDGESGEISGCDGCLNPTGMMTDMLETFNTGTQEFNGPDLIETNNNGLMFTADILEEIYTNKDFPDNVESLAVSMMESGKSRADLWAFAGLVAAEWGIENNNLACQGDPRKSSRTCGHVYGLEENCEMTWTKPPVFKTGRKDCEPDPTLSRPFLTTRHEAHPNPQGNGPSTVDFYAQHFGFTAREAICLTEGAHSFGKFNSQISMMKYFWTRSQEMLLNNQLFRHLAERPQYFMNCKDHSGKDQYVLVGDAYGELAQTKWVVNSLGMSENGGPFHWFHRYDRCPASNECAALDLGLGRAEPESPSDCCNIEPGSGMHCTEECQRFIQNDETALGADTGFYHKFQTDPVSGRPSGCTGFTEKWMQGTGPKIVYPNCEKEDYAPEGEPLFAIVDDYADNMQKWMDDFFDVLDKMMSNGYTEADLSVNPFNILDHH